ncbi:Na(+)/H(+) antiporter subunit B [Anaplasmataceae bacterium AB001_6]|nr:Na(+)/H(+) antiporter subunit B [Anaplasmataceae bacterium AB001_6]
MKNNFIIKSILFLIFPLIILYGCYIQFYGEDSPGGGFQSGLIFSYAFILYKFVFCDNKIIKLSFFLDMSFWGVFIYFCTGLYSIFFGGYFLDYEFFSNNIVTSRHIGVFAVELGVFITVFSVMVSIFLIFYELCMVKKSDK